MGHMCAMAAQQDKPMIDWLTSFNSLPALEAEAINGQSLTDMLQYKEEPFSAGPASGEGIGSGTPSVHSGGSAVTSHDTLSDKERHKLASKKAQQKFREKQKEQLNALLKEVAEKSAAYQHLTKENEELKLRSRVLERVVICRENMVDLLTQLKAACPGMTIDLCKETSEWSVPGHTYGLSSAEADKFKNMTTADFIKTWKEYLSQVSSYLVRCDGPNPDEALLSKLIEVVDRYHLTTKQAMVINSDAVRRAMVLNLETGQPGTADDAHWLGVVSSLNLSLPQRQDIVEILNLYRGLLEKVYEERKLLMTAMGTACQDVVSVVDRNSLADDMEVLEHLKANMRKEHCARTLLHSNWLATGLSASQAAKVAMNSYPYFPDILAISIAVEQTSAELGHTGKHPRS